MSRSLKSLSFVDAASTDAEVVEQAGNLLEGLNWLSPIPSLRKQKGKDFGRAITQAISELTKANDVVCLSVRNIDKAVVMPMEHYEEMLKVHSACNQLLEYAKATEIQLAASLFDDLYADITTSRKGTDFLFSASPDELNANYSPGDTEQI